MALPKGTNYENSWQVMLSQWLKGDTVVYALADFKNRKSRTDLQATATTLCYESTPFAVLLSKALLIDCRAAPAEILTYLRRKAAKANLTIVDMPSHHYVRNYADCMKCYTNEVNFTEAWAHYVQDAIENFLATRNSRDLAISNVLFLVHFVHGVAKHHKQTAHVRRLKPVMAALDTFMTYSDTRADANRANVVVESRCLGYKVGTRNMLAAV